MLLNCYGQHCLTHAERFPPLRRSERSTQAVDNFVLLSPPSPLTSLSRGTALRTELLPQRGVKNTAPQWRGGNSPQGSRAAPPPRTAGGDGGAPALPSLTDTRTRHAWPWGVMDVDPWQLDKAGRPARARRSHDEALLPPGRNAPPCPPRSAAVLTARRGCWLGAVRMSSAAWWSVRLAWEHLENLPSLVLLLSLLEEARISDSSRWVFFKSLSRCSFSGDFPFLRLSRALPWGLSHRSPGGPAGVRVPLRLLRLDLPQALISAG